MTFHEEGRKQLLRAREQEARLLKAQALGVDVDELLAACREEQGEWFRNIRVWEQLYAEAWADYDGKPP